MKRYNYIKHIVDRLTSSDSNNEEFTLYNHLVEKLSGTDGFFAATYTQAPTGIRGRLPTSVMIIGRTAFISKLRRVERRPMP